MAITTTAPARRPGGARRVWALVAIGLAGLCLSACASLSPEAPSAPRGVIGAQTGRSAVGPRYKVGAPYRAGGVWYVPAEQPDYDEVGVASWYGDAFNGKRTANGEIFNMNAPSAAHATLPMPCMVEVTNLDNGRVMTLRMNDRGPFHPGRIIDLSHAAATQLGFAGKGTARVRVRYAGPAPVVAAAPPLTYAARPQRPPPRPAIGGAEPGGDETGWVQVGAYAQRDAADRAAAQLDKTGEVDVRPVSHNGQPLYRVVVRLAAGSAEGARLRLASLGFADARPVAGF